MKMHCLVLFFLSMQKVSKDSWNLSRLVTRAVLRERALFFHVSDFGMAVHEWLLMYYCWVKPGQAELKHNCSVYLSVMGRLLFT